MNTTLRKCVDCGRLFAAREGAQQCQNCTNDEQTVFKRIEDAVLKERIATVAEIAASLGVDASVVRRVLDDMPHLADQVENDELCLRCGIRPAKVGKDYCPSCLMELNVGLRDLVGVIQRERHSQDRRPEARMQKVSVTRALHEKQRRTGHYRFDPVPPNIKRGR